jgi:hypothetical protein
MEKLVMATRTLPNAFFNWTWSAVLAGVFASLVVQILLTMLGFGVGLLAIDVPTAQSAPAGAGWAAFVWWAVSGIIAAFVGGAVARSPSQAQLEEARQHFAHVMFASFCALLLGAGAAYAAGMATTGRAVGDAARPVT